MRQSKVPCPPWPAGPALGPYTSLTLSRIPDAAIWSFRINGELVPVTVSGPLSADSADFLVRLAIEGAGIVRLGEIAVANAIHNGLLEPLLQDSHESESFPLLAVMPPGRQRALKVRVFLDFLIERFASAPWRSVTGTGRQEHTPTPVLAEIAEAKGGLPKVVESGFGPTVITKPKRFIQSSPWGPVISLVLPDLRTASTIHS